MGDRLVQRISYNGKFLAASYQHWSAGDADGMQDVLDDVIYQHGLFDSPENATPENAVKCLIEADKIFYKQEAGMGLHHHKWSITDVATWQPVKYKSYFQRKFLKAHPEIPRGTGRTEGWVTVDPKIADSWERWAEALNNFAWSD